ncbi:MAG TPA: HemK/PrmC family methyltransferase [Acidimicrobiales bacterium]|nr:HemK/PrmC family methyltransferase [Acidimicrobiales bacterium]
MAPDGLLGELAATIGSRQEARWVLEELDARDDLDDVQRVGLARALAARRATGVPLQYVLGHWPFRDLDLLVDPRALIPRPETEVLVSLALERLAARDGSVACDLGCGTGAIALSLAVEQRRRGRHVELHATDVDVLALELAMANAERAGVGAISFHRGSWFEALPAGVRGRVDVCCSNPPYVSIAERRGLAVELDFEPEGALVAADGTDGTPGFAAVEAVVSGARGWLAPGGTLLVEHADTHRDAATSLAARCGLDVVSDHDDLAGRPRVLEARMPS